MKTSLFILVALASFSISAHAACKKVGGIYVDENNQECSPNGDSHNMFTSDANGNQHEYNPADAANDQGALKQQVNNDNQNSPKTSTGETADADPKKQKRGGGCGDRSFGGADCETTEMINLGVGVANKLYQGVGSAAVQNKGTDVMNTLNAKGINVSNQDYLNGQADVAEKASKANRNAGMAQTANAALQAWRAMEHNKSGKVVEENYNDRKKTYEGNLAGCTKQTPDGPVTDAACKSEWEDKIARLGQDYEAERMAQRKTAIQTGVAAALTAEQAGASYMQANMAKKTAEELRKRAEQGGGAQGNPYFYNNQMQPGMNQGELVGTPQVESGAVVSNDPNEASLDGGFKDFNPNVGQNGALGPMAGEFKEGEAKGSGGGQGNGLGGSGGTSASRGEEGGKQEGGPGKPENGGKYAAGEGSGSKFSRGSANTPVGVDSSFADLLKKMLPGSGDEKKDQASLEMPQDRSPASDQAAVIGRNKNIFIEISKRYQKKHTEGAVTFQ